MNIYHSDFLVQSIPQQRSLGSQSLTTMVLESMSLYRYQCLIRGSQGPLGSILLKKRVKIARAQGMTTMMYQALSLKRNLAPPTRHHMISIL